MSLAKKLIKDCKESSSNLAWRKNQFGNYGTEVAGKFHFEVQSSVSGWVATVLADVEGYTGRVLAKSTFSQADQAKKYCELYAENH